MTNGLKTTTCECGETVIDALDQSGKPMPLDVEKAHGGQYRVLVSHANLRPVCRKLTPTEVTTTGFGVLLWVSHLTTCKVKHRRTRSRTS